MSKRTPQSLRRPGRNARLKAALIFVAVVWPALTIVGTTIAAVHFPYYTPAWPVALSAAVVSLAILLPSMLLPAGIFCALAWAVFKIGGSSAGQPRGVRVALLEPTLLFVALLFGAACWYPAVLNLPILWPLHGLPVWALLLVLLGVITAGVWSTGAPRQSRLLAALVAAGLLLPVPQLAASAWWRPNGFSSDTVLLGIDSVSQADDLSTLRALISRSQGTWYDRAVTPGLLTNAVWTSILTERPVHEHGVFVTFQRFPSGQARLLDAARAAGYRTVSFFPNQLTCAVGSEAGFDVDLSGPIGWRQLMLPPEVDSTLLLPLLSPVLPRLPFTAVPSNFAGTFTYDVRRDLQRILHAGAAGQKTFVAAHLTYLHEPDYPRWIDLSWREVRAVATAPVRRIQDRSFDAMSADDPGDPVQLRAWKLARLERIVSNEVGLATARGSRVVLFSDHGDRVGLSPETFADPRYHHVLLATVNLPPRDPDRPISLIAIGALADIDPKADGPPVVEFAVPPQSTWGELFRSAHLDWGGAVRLDETLLGSTLRLMGRHSPYPARLETTSSNSSSSDSAEPRSAQ